MYHMLVCFLRLFVCHSCQSSLCAAIVLGRLGKVGKQRLGE